MAKKVLIIDDDNDFIESARVIIESQGNELDFANTAEEGINKAQSTNPDVILLDVMMTTDVDGLDVAIKLRDDSTTKDIPVLMLTGIRKPDMLLESYAPGESFPNIKAIYEKPLSPDFLIRVIAKDY